MRLAPLLLPFVIACWISPAVAATFVVDTTAAANLNACTAAPADCSLPGAITAAGLAVGADTVAFDIPMSDPGCTAATGVCRIVLGTTLPSISQPLVIDGYTQPGAQPNTIPAPGANNAQLKIEVTAATTLFDPLGPNNTTLTLRGLALFIPSNRMIGGFGSPSIVVQGNWIGVTAAGAPPDYTTGTSALVLSIFFRTIVVGGPLPADRNVIAGSGRDQNGLPGGGGNELRANSASGDRALVLFQGNLVGLAPDGITPLPFRDPLTVRSGDDTFETPDIRILDNRFVRPARSFGGNFGGALVFSTARTMTAPALIQGNVFGLGVDGSRPGVERDAIRITLGNNSHVPRLRIGGASAGEANVFAATIAAPGAGDLGSAVQLPSGNVATFVEFTGNRVLGNDGIGLDFPMPTAGGGVRYGRSPNDAGDPDTGANSLQNFPEISTFAINGAQLDLGYRVDSAVAASQYPVRVDFYRALGDEGEVRVGSDTYTAAEAQTVKTISLTPTSPVTVDDVIVAIATDADGRSSEFSFQPLQLTLEQPLPSNCGGNVHIFCDGFDTTGLPSLEVRVRATSSTFKPNGLLRVTSNRNASSCQISLRPTQTPLTSNGSCILVGAGAPGPITITATYDTLTGAFGSATGENITINQAFTVVN